MNLRTRALRPTALGGLTESGSCDFRGISCTPVPNKRSKAVGSEHLQLKKLRRTSMDQPDDQGDDEQ